MFFNGSIFWFLMGAVTILVMIGFNTFATERGWKLDWWKWLLILSWYFFTCISFYTFGTLVGENESSAGFKLFLLGLFVSLTLGVGLWRLLSRESRTEPPNDNRGVENEFRQAPYDSTATEFPEETQG